MRGLRATVRRDAQRFGRMACEHCANCGNGYDWRFCESGITKNLGIDGKWARVCAACKGLGKGCAIDAIAAMLFSGQSLGRNMKAARVESGLRN